MMADVDTKNALEPVKPHAPHPAWTLLLYVFLAATLCFVAYQIRLCVKGHPPAPPRMPDMGVADIRRPEPPQSQPWDPAQAGQSPLSEANLTPLNQDPLGLPPPPGAKPISGYEQRPPGRLYQQRTYKCPGDLETLKAYYVKWLGQEGFSLSPEKPAGDSVGLRFTKGGNYGILSLRKIPGQVKMVEIRLIVISVVTSE
jgi:hypothetical protein